MYTDDLPHYDNELYAGLILSTESHARFTIDSSPLEGMVNGIINYQEFCF